MPLEHREQGQTRQEILALLRRRGQLTASELSTLLGIGAVGIRQHMALLERDGLVYTAAVRRGVGRPSHLYALTSTAEALFPRRYERLLLDALDMLAERCGPEAIDELFVQRSQALVDQYSPRLQGKSAPDRVTELAQILTEQGYMCECEHQPDGSVVLVEYNCPINCAALKHRQACSHELKLYQDLLGVELICEGTIADGGTCCRFRSLS